jgi:hypothetical protein
MDIRTRDFKAVAIALVLVVVGVVAAGSALLWFHRIHRDDVAALRRDPSYRFGLHVDIRGINDDVADRCRARIVANNPPIPGFSTAKAVVGCIDEWHAVNS